MHESFYSTLPNQENRSPPSSLTMLAILLSACNVQHFAADAEPLLLSVTGRRVFWSLAKTISLNFFPSSFRPICSSGDFVCEPCEKAGDFISRFLSSSASLNYPTPLVYSSPTVPHSPPLLRITKIRQALRSLIVCKPLGPDGIPSISLKCVVTSWLLFYVTSFVFQIFQLSNALEPP